jgi:ubiquitin carboxyl-terminal hydrolase 7
LKKYIEVETMEGQNQYEAEGYGKQDAKKGIRFSYLPPVL